MNQQSNIRLVTPLPWLSGDLRHRGGLFPIPCRDIFQCSLLLALYVYIQVWVGGLNVYAKFRFSLALSVQNRIATVSISTLLVWLEPPGSLTHALVSLDKLT